jgi:hypothetical protein
MCKLELKTGDVICYFEHGLKCKTKHGILDLNSIKTKGRYKYWFTSTSKFNKEILASLNCCGKGFSRGQIKPILRPLSDLGKMNINDLFTEKGGGFKSIEHFRQHFINNIVFSKIDTLAHSTVNWLHKNHFDTKDLIGQGLAISINDINDLDKLSNTF